MLAYPILNVWSVGNVASSQLPSFHPQRSDFSRPDPLPSVSSLNPLSTLHLHIFIKPFKVGENKYLPSTPPFGKPDPKPTSPMSTEAVECKKRAGEPRASPAHPCGDSGLGGAVLLLPFDAAAHHLSDRPPSGMRPGFDSLSHAVIPSAPGSPPTPLATLPLLPEL